MGNIKHIVFILSTFMLVVGCSNNDNTSIYEANENNEMVENVNEEDETNV